MKTFHRLKKGVVLLLATSCGSRAVAAEQGSFFSTALAEHTEQMSLIRAGESYSAFLGGSSLKGESLTARRDDDLSYWSAERDNMLFNSGESHAAFVNTIGLATERLSAVADSNMAFGSQGGKNESVDLSLGYVGSDQKYGKERSEFATAFLEELPGITEMADISLLSDEVEVLPGEYEVKVRVNKRRAQTHLLDFKIMENKAGSLLQPCVTPEWLGQIGILPEYIQAKIPNKSPTDKESILPGTDPSCFAISDLVEKSKVVFYPADVSLEISVPQIALKSENVLQEERWDDGIPAAFVDYNYSGSQNKTDLQTTTNNFLSLRSGVNLGAWRFRNFASGEPKRLKSAVSYFYRDIRPWRAQLMIGETYTSSRTLDSVSFKGIKLSSDQDMKPFSEYYAPVIRGIANSNARVRVERDGYTVLETYVGAGPFEFNELPSFGGSGDYKVTVEEEDGKTTSFVVPYSSIPGLERYKNLNYSVSLGKYNGAGLTNLRRPLLFQGDVAYGLFSNHTVFGGMIMTDRYQGLSLGMSSNLGRWGSVAVDITHATSRFNERTVSGRSYRWSYAKEFNSVGTSINLASLRYSTDNYYTFSDFYSQYHLSHWQRDYDPIARTRSTQQLSFSQTLGRWGACSVGLSRTNYWHSAGNQKSHFGSYSKALPLGMTFNLNYSENRVISSSTVNRSLYGSINMPIGSGRNRPTVHYNHNRATAGVASHYVSLSGQVPDYNLSYSVGHTHSNSTDASDSTSLSLTHTGYLMDKTINYSQTSNTKYLNYSLRGGVLLHQHGVTLSRPMGDTMVLVRASGAQGVKVSGASNADWRGHSIITNATPYRENLVSLNPDTLSEKIELKESELSIVPTRGAVVLAKFKTRSGHRAFVELTKSDGSKLPYGSQLTMLNDTDKENIGLVDEEGMAFISGLADEGTLLARWGLQEGQSCKANYAVTREIRAAAEDMPVNLVLKCAQ